MDLKTVCMCICRTAVNTVGECKSPIAYINVRVGKKFSFSDAEFLEAFNSMKWDTAVSTADLGIVHDENLDCAVKVEKVSDFFDEDGKCNVFEVPEDKSVIM
ncbi:MAG: hypothetical protein K6B43_13195 [Treponema sp.]|nr:hypothetical protein [Treponema sp.]